MPCFRLEQCDHRHARHATSDISDEGPTMPQLRAFSILNSRLSFCAVMRRLWADEGDWEESQYELSFIAC